MGRVVREEIRTRCLIQEVERKCSVSICELPPDANETEQHYRAHGSVKLVSLKDTDMQRKQLETRSKLDITHSPLFALASTLARILP